MLTKRMLATIAVLPLVGAACAGDPGPPVTGTDVTVVDNDFEPAHLGVSVGEPVTWTWAGSADHNVVGRGLESETQSEGTFTHTFDEPGEYPYECTLHGGMRGKVTVTE